MLTRTETMYTVKGERSMVSSSVQREQNKIVYRAIFRQSLYGLDSENRDD